MKKNEIEKTVNEKQVKKLEAEKLKKQKAREAKKAKRLALIEKRKAKVEANKKRRAAKKAKKLARLEKIKAKKIALRQKKQEARQKKLERLAKQKAKAKELKQKAKEKAKLQKQKETTQKPVKTPETKDTIDITVKLLKQYVKDLAKNAAGIDEKKIKKLEKLGFTFTDDAVGFIFNVEVKGKKCVKPEVVVEPDDVIVEDTIDTAIDEVIGDKGDAIEALAKELETDDEKPATEVPVGDTFTDDATIADEQPSSFDDEEDEEDDTYDDFRDEEDDDKVDFRKDWNQEFDDDGERNENW